MEKKIVEIELRTVIDHQGDKEMSIVKQNGEYIAKRNIEVIKYTEQRDDIGNVENFITIHPDRVTIKRTGSITMSQKFELDKKSASIYRHPYGTFHLEIETEKLRCRPLQINKIGEIIIEYTAVINGLEKQHHHLTLTYTEEKEA